MASTFTTERIDRKIETVRDLDTVRVGTVARSVGEAYLRRHAVTYRSFPFAIYAVKALRRGEIDAVVFEKVALKAMVDDYGWNEIHILRQNFDTLRYAFLLPERSPYEEAINRAVLKVVQGKQWKQIETRYLGVSF